MQSFRLERSSGLSRRVSAPMAAVIIGVCLLLMFAWTQNTFDNFLWRVHLNHSTCIQNGFGAVFCGSAATNYQNRLRDAGINP